MRVGYGCHGDDRRKHVFEGLMKDAMIETKVRMKFGRVWRKWCYQCEQYILEDDE